MQLHVNINFYRMPNKQTFKTVACLTINTLTQYIWQSSGFTGSAVTNQFVNNVRDGVSRWRNSSSSSSSSSWIWHTVKTLWQQWTQRNASYTHINTWPTYTWCSCFLVSWQDLNPCNSHITPWYWVPKSVRQRWFWALPFITAARRSAAVAFD